MGKIKLTSFELKIIAMVAMIIDHVGLIFFPHLVFMRDIGRLSFPLFAFLLSEGYYYTSNKMKYLSRLGIFAIVSEIPYDLLFYKSSYYTRSQNVLFTLFIAFIAMLCVDYLMQRGTIGIIMSIVAAGIFCMIAELTHGDYGWYGVIIVLLFHLLRNKKVMSCVSFAGANTVYTLSRVFSIQHFAVFSLFPILLYNGKKGKYSLKYFFYVFYPLHLTILYLIKTFLM